MAFQARDLVQHQFAHGLVGMLAADVLVQARHGAEDAQSQVAGVLGAQGGGSGHIPALDAGNDFRAGWFAATGAQQLHQF